MNERVRFGSRLREEREARAMTLGELARVTKIPTRSLERLEEGRFEELPADVFVRGFIRSYARAVGLDPDGLLRSYGQLTSGDKKVLPSLAAGTAPRRDATPKTDVVVTGARARQLLDGTSTSTSTDASRAGEKRTADTNDLDAAADKSAADRTPARRPDDSNEMSTLSKAILDATSRGTRRYSLTLAVIILVIVATLTLSLLLRRPSHVGDGVSFEQQTSVVSLETGDVDA